MDRPRRQLLAAAGLAVDEHRRLALGEAFDEAADLLHRRRRAEQVIGARRLRFFRDLQRLLDQCPQLLERYRLRQIVERAGLERRDGVLRTAERRDDGDRDVETFLVDVLDDAQALAIGQPHVGQAQIEWLLVEETDGLGHRFRARRVEAHARQRELQQLEQVRLVVDHEDFGLPANFSYHDVVPCTHRPCLFHADRSRVDARFNVIRKWAPGPLGSNSSAAPLASASSRAM